MAHTQDYVPPKDSEFDGWLENLVKYVNTRQAGPSRSGASFRRPGPRS
ncbi:hypothetical protein AGMMS49579_25870 [Spirochaetia bacterium]|nr:hypothetical protein AGMMS49579_25870 [Spirochaetia bacterium]